MRKIAQLVALLSLILLIGPSILFLAGRMTHNTVKTVMFVATVIWFIAASLWLWHNNNNNSNNASDSAS